MDLSNLFGEHRRPEAAQVDPNRLISGVQEVFASKGGVEGLVSSLRAGGLGGVVDSWVSTGTNEPVQPQQLGAALGPDTVNQLSAKTGLSIETLLPLLAGLPADDHRSPDAGRAGSARRARRAARRDIGDLLGGILGGGLGGILGGR